MKNISLDITKAACFLEAGAVEAFDYLAVFVAHRCAVLEDGHRILCIVVQIAGTQGLSSHK